MSKKPSITVTISPCHSIKDTQDLLPDEWETMTDQEIKDDIHEFIEAEKLWDLFTMEVRVTR